MVAQTNDSGNPPGSVGRPAFQITPDVIKQAESLAGRGMTQAQIAKALGMGESTLYEKLHAFPEFAEAIKRGKAKGIAVVAGKLMEKINALDTGAIIFYLKSQAGWRENTQITVTGEDGAPLFPALNVMFIDAAAGDDQPPAPPQSDSNS